MTPEQTLTIEWSAEHDGIKVTNPEPYPNGDALTLLITQDAHGGFRVSDRGDTSRRLSLHIPLGHAARERLWRQHALSATQANTGTLALTVPLFSSLPAATERLFTIMRRIDAQARTHAYQDVAV